MKPEETQSVTYRLSPADVVALRREITAARLRNGPIFVIAVFVGIGASLGWSVGVASGGPRWQGLLVGATLGYAGFRGLVRLSESREVRHHQAVGAFDEQTLVIGPEGYEQTFSNGRRTTCPWSAVLNVGLKPDYLAIWMNENGGIIVPRRAFASESESKLFALRAYRWHNNANELATDPPG